MTYSQRPEVREGRQMMLDIMEAEGWKAYDADPPDVDLGEGIESCEDLPGPNYEPDPDLDPEPGPQPIEGVIASYFADLIGGKL